MIILHRDHPDLLGEGGMTSTGTEGREVVGGVAGLDGMAAGVVGEEVEVRQGVLLHLERYRWKRGMWRTRIGISDHRNLRVSARWKRR